MWAAMWFLLDTGEGNWEVDARKVFREAFICVGRDIASRGKPLTLAKVIHHPRWEPGSARTPFRRLAPAPTPRGGTRNRPALLRVGHPNAGGLRAGPGRAAGAALQGALAQPSSFDYITPARFNNSGCRRREREP